MNKTRIIAVRYCRLRGCKSYVILLQDIMIEIPELLRVSGSRPSLKFIALEKVGIRKFNETCIMGWRSNRAYVTNVIFHRWKCYLVRKNIMTHFLRIKLQNSSVLLFYYYSNANKVTKRYVSRVRFKIESRDLSVR